MPKLWRLKWSPMSTWMTLKKNEGDLLSTKSPGGVERQIWRLLHIKRAFVKLLLCPEITFNKMWYSGQIKLLPLETLLCSFLDMLWINNKPMLYMPEDPRQKIKYERKSWHPALQCFLRPLSDKQAQNSLGCNLLWRGLVNYVILITTAILSMCHASYFFLTLDAN